MLKLKFINNNNNNYIKIYKKIKKIINKNIIININMLKNKNFYLKYFINEEKFNIGDDELYIKKLYNINDNIFYDKNFIKILSNIKNNSVLGLNNNDI